MEKSNYIAKSKISFVGLQPRTSDEGALQRTVSLWVWNTIFAKGTSAGTATQANMAFQEYHGDSKDEDRIGFGHQMVQGLNMLFQVLFFEQMDTGDGNLELKELFHCQPLTYLCIVVYKQYKLLVERDYSRHYFVY